VHGIRAERHIPALVVLVALLGTLLAVVRPAPAQALQTGQLVINEIVAANDSFVDSFGDTPDWIEIRNVGSASVELAGWTIADQASSWTLPSGSLGPGQRRLIFASGRDLTGSEWHTNFSLKRNGEPVSLAAPDGSLVDTVTYPAMADDTAYGRGSSGGLGVLLSPTPGSANTALAPAGVSITTPPQTFRNSLSISMVAETGPGEQIRYTTNSTPVSTSSTLYTGPITINNSTVVRAAVVGNGVVGPEANAGYIAISSTIENFSSDIPIVLVHSTGTVGQDTQDAIVSVIDRGANGRAGIFDQADYMGFAGLRIRGASSTQFPKKQYKFELWGDRLGDEVPANLLGLGSDSDWGLYAPGFYDRAMINNPLMYELAKRIGVLAPGYQFVELYIEDNFSSSVGDSDYLGLYILRETIKVADGRVDITEHTPTSSGPEGGYIVRYDWNDSCCANIDTTRFGSRVAVDAPSQVNITNGQLNYIDGWWSDLQNAAASGSFSQVDQYIDFDSFIDHWLLEILALDVDMLRASHYMHLDAGGQLQGGPMWDYDRALGGRDDRVNELFEARAWEPNGSSGHSYESDVYEDLWAMPEVQARLRARWAELRQGVLSDTQLAALMTSMGDEIQEAYVREDGRWGNTSGYGSRYGNLTGEINWTIGWVAERTQWLDDQFISNTSPPSFNLPNTRSFEESVPFTYQVDVASQGGQQFYYAATGLPEGLSINEDTGLISGTVAYGDARDAFTVSVTVTNSSGAGSTDTMTLSASAPATRTNPVLLNEYNAVAPGRLLDLNGSDSTFGQTGGNGGDWFELVTMTDNLDMRGWSFQTWSNNAQGQVVQTSNLILGQDDLFSSIRAGTILTVAESVADDVSYDPRNDDWTINLQSVNTQQGQYWSNQTSFDTNNTRWRLVIRDASGSVVSNVLGETTPAFDDPALRVDEREVWAVYSDPTATLANVVYGPTVASTFGAPNRAAPGAAEQDFSALRPEIVMMGDVNCTDTISVSDALFIAQFSVGNRTDFGRCPLDDPATQINAQGADVSGNGNVSIQDALLVAQCAVGNPNAFCPQD